MRVFRYTCLWASLLGLLFSCSVPETEESVDAVTNETGRAIIVNPEETRTSFDSYVGKFAWSDGDEIAIHLSDGTFYSTAVNAETGAFTCSTTPS